MFSMPYFRFCRDCRSCGLDVMGQECPGAALGLFFQRSVAGSTQRAVWLARDNFPGTVPFRSVVEATASGLTPPIWSAQLFFAIANRSNEE